MTRLDAAFRRVSDVTMLIAGALIIFSTVVIAVEVTIRKVFSMSIGGSDEISGYLFAISCALSWTSCVIERANIRIDALHHRLPPPAQAILDALGAALLFILVAMLAYTASYVIRSSLTTGARAITPLATPLIIPQTIWFLALLIFVLCLGIVLARTLLALARRDWARASALAGGPTVTEAIDLEVAAARLRVAADAPVGKGGD